MYNLSVLLVTDVLILSRIKEEVADRSYERVNTECDIAENEVKPCSGCESFGLKRCVVDNEASDPTKEKCQNKANDLVVIHCVSPFKTLFMCTHYTYILYNSFSQMSIAFKKFFAIYIYKAPCNRAQGFFTVTQLC